MQTLQLLLRFICDIVLGMVMFVILGGAGYALGRFVKLLERNGLSEFLLVGLKFIEYMVFLVDACSFLFLVAMSGIRFGRDVWRVYR